MKKLLTIVASVIFFAIISGQIFKTNNQQQLLKRFDLLNPEAYQLAISDMHKEFPERFKKQKKYLDALDEFENTNEALRTGIIENNSDATKRAEILLNTLDEGLLSNPLLDIDKIILLRRELGKRARMAKSGELGIAPANFNNNSSIANPSSGWKNEISVLSNIRGKRKISTLYKPDQKKVINDLVLNYDGKELMFSSIGTHEKWHLFSLNTANGKVEQITPNDIEDYDSFDGCFLPDGRIIYCSTATFLGLPCINGRPRMCGLYQINRESQEIRQLTFDQDSNWEPVMMNNGKVLYQRWEYSGLPHSNSRILFNMNPDGTAQAGYYGSNSYFPTAFFGSRSIPDHPTAVVGIATGHHSVSRAGRMLIIDPAVGRQEADGVIAEIPHRGRKVEPIIRDRLPDGVWPLFMNPYPLSDKYFLVSMKADANALWGLYLVDVFDNMTLLYEQEGEAVIEAMPFEAPKKPQIIPDRVNLENKSATVFLQDIYEGPGLEGVTEGEVDKIRIGSYFFSPYGQGGLLGTIGMDGPWDVMRVLGTVPVEKDGSAMFDIPANTPVFLQPLDKEGKALQQMRSWFSAMPGERVSCVGCHEDKNSVPMPKMTIASKKAPSKIEEWHGPARGFSFHHEVQPILDKHCVSCHNDDNPALAYLKGDRMIKDWDTQISGKADPSYGGHFSESYTELHRFVRRPGIESDMHMLQPMDVHADQTELIQMLKKGHHNVQLDKESLEKLYCWIDFNAPFHGQRKDIPNYCDAEVSVENMKFYASKYAGIQLEFDNLPEPSTVTEAIIPEPYEKIKSKEKAPKNWPIKTVHAQNLQINLNRYQQDIPLGNGVSVKMVKVPQGSFMMGSDRNRDEMPKANVQIDKPYWIGRFEITNEQFAVFDPEHTSGVEHRHGYQFGRAGYPLDNPSQPVVRVSWQQAMEFCKWLSKKTGKKFILPTEAQWEWACRAGSGSDFSFGNLEADYSLHANLGDKKLSEFAACTAHKHYESVRIIDNPNKYDDWIPHDTKYNDAGFVSENVGRYRANPWDLYDMHGNVWEWTRSDYKQYPYKDNDGRNNLDEQTEKVARGGSWYSRPKRSTSSYRLPYRTYQKVYDVGFRVVMEE